MQKVIDRLKEPSSYAALAAVLALAGVQIPSEAWGYGVQAAAAIAGLIGFFLAEKKA